MGPSSENLSCTSGPSRSLLQRDSLVAQDSQGNAPASTTTQRGPEEEPSAFAVELEEIRRLRAARYRASKDAASHPCPTAVSSSVCNGSSSHGSDSSSSGSWCLRNEDNKTGECGSGVGCSDSSVAVLLSSPCQQSQTSNELTASDASLGGQAPAPGSTAGRTECAEVEVIDGDEEGSDVVSVSELDGVGEFTCSTMETKQLVAAGALPIWEDQFDLLTWNVDGLDSEALRSRTTAVVDLIIALRPAVVFLQEVVPSTLTMLRGKLEKSYYIFTPSLRVSVVGSVNTTTSTSSSSRNTCDTGTGSSECCSQNAVGAGRSNEVQDNIGFPYFVVILLCREQMVPLTPEALCEWFPRSHMGRHMLGVVAAPVSRPDDRLLLLTSHLESLKEFRVERLNQFKRCMRILTDTFAHDDDDGCSGAGEDAVKFRKEEAVGTEETLTTSGRKSGDFSKSENKQERKRAHDTNRGAVGCEHEIENLGSAEKNAEEDERHMKKSRSAKEERRCRKTAKADASDGGPEGKKERSRHEVSTCDRRERSKVEMRDIPAFVGIFGGDMNLRDNELQVPSAVASKGRVRQQNRGHSRSKSRANTSGSSENALCTNGCTSKTPMRSDQTTEKTVTSKAAEGGSFVFPGVEDVWEFLGRPAGAEFTWDMLRNDNKQSGKWRSRLRFDRLYWYGMPAHEAGWKQQERHTRRSNVPVRLRSAAEDADVQRNVATDESSAAAGAASEALSSPKLAETISAAPTEEGRCKDSSSVEQGQRDRLRVTRWTWKPEDMRLVGTRRIPSCGRFPSDHFGLLTKFRRHSIGENSPVSAG